MFDLRHKKPAECLRKFCDHKKRRFYNFRVLVCGGDGTVGWVLTEIDIMDYHNPPPIAVLPLGTGNDLARTLGWGGGYERSDDLLNLLVHVRKGGIVDVDRWKVTVRCPTSETDEGMCSWLGVLWA